MEQLYNKNQPSGWRTILVLLVFLTVLGSFSARAMTFTVTNVNDSGDGSLRTAIMEANTNAGLDSIVFDIEGTGPFSIVLASPLPTITDPVIIDGTSQPGYSNSPQIEINGSAIGSGNDGLYIVSGYSMVKGLAVNRCPRDGIRLESLGTNTIAGNYLGTDTTGTVPLPNGEGGLMINGSPGNLIGGTAAAARNLISGNLNGIYILTDASVGNTVEGNYIGTDVTGEHYLGNTLSGIEMSDCPSNVVGGTAAGAGNVISGNGQSGVYVINFAADYNLIEGNFIGVDASGTLAISNHQDGVTIYSGIANTVGGASAAARNVLSGNAESGVFIWGPGASGNQVIGNYIGTDITGTQPVPNLTNGVTIYNVANNVIGGTAPGTANIISGNHQDGVLIIYGGANNNTVEGNYIGLDASGEKALANAYDGVTLQGASGNYIISGNVISGNTSNGILLVNLPAADNVIQGNFIGTDVTGTMGIGNLQAGVYLAASDNTIGGTTAEERNIISGNLENGIFVYSAGDQLATNNLIIGNYIGTDATGTAALGNGFSGIAVSNSLGTIIGESGAGNLISGNVNSGIDLGGSLTTGTILQGNYIGTDLTGDIAVPNQNGGIQLYGAPGNLIGGNFSGAGNVVSGNDQDGIAVQNPGADSNVIEGNFVGTKADGASPLGNLLHNIDFMNTASWNTVGGSGPSADNHIAYSRTSGYDGIRNRPEQGDIGNFISQNSIFTNGNSSPSGLGIKCSPSAVTHTNLPYLSAAVSSSGTWIAGNFTNSANNAATFLLQFYANISPNISGYGEGRTYLASTQITTSASGAASFRLMLNTNVAPGTYLAATATDPNNSTWEFGPDILVIAPPVLKASRVATNSALIAFSWTTNSAGFVLQSTTNLSSPGSWLNVTNHLVVSGSSNSVLIPSYGPDSFYRLIY